MQDNKPHPLIEKHFEHVESLLHEYIGQLFFQLDLTAIDEESLTRCRERMNDIMQIVGRILNGITALMESTQSLHAYDIHIRRIKEQHQSITELSSKVIDHLKQLLPPDNSLPFTLPIHTYSMRHSAQMINTLL